MTAYPTRCLLESVVIFFGATLIVFAMVFAIPGDPIRALGGEKSMAPHVIDQLKAEFHLPVVTFLAVDLGLLMGGAIVPETIFNIPGIGRSGFEAVRAQEGAVVVGIVTILVIISAWSWTSSSRCSTHGSPITDD